VAQTFEDQEAIQLPNVAKAPVCWFSFKEHMAWPINKDVDSIRELAIYPYVFNWGAEKPRRECALVRRETEIEVRVLFESDTCAVLVTAKVPKEFWKGWSRTEFLWCTNEIIADNTL